MKKRFYLDTSIWRDYFEDRVDNLRPLGLFAFQFLNECRKRNYKVLYSEIVIHELKNRLTDQQINSMFSEFKEILVKVQDTKEQLMELTNLVKKFKESHRTDILHAILARDNTAVMIARDKGFESLQEIVECKKPEEIIFD